MHYTTEHYIKHMSMSQNFKYYLSIVQENLIQVTKPATYVARVLGLYHGYDSGLKVFAILLSSSKSGVLKFSVPWTL